MDYLLVARVRNSMSCVCLAVTTIAVAGLVGSRMAKAHSGYYLTYCRVTVPDIDTGNVPFFLSMLRVTTLLSRCCSEESRS